MDIAAESLEEAKKLLNVLSEVGEVLVGKDGFNAVMIRALKVLTQRCGVLRAVVLLTQADTKKMQVAVAYRLPASERHLQRWLLSFGKADIIQEVIRSQTGKLIRQKGASSHATDSWLFCQPIISDEKTVLGVLSLELAEAAEIDEKNTRELFRVIGVMIAQALLVNRLVEDATQRMLNDDADLRAELSKRYDFSRIISNSGPMRQVYEQIAQIACTNATVLISGETGTGKELIAHALHVNSPRADKPFLKVNCGALVESLIETELFGHERGAFTDASERRHGRFEAANGGTLFLDEIGELSLAMQAKLLRVLQTREYERVGGTQTIYADVRVIAATNRELEQEVKAGRFRSDLYYRLNVFAITVPTLRERRADVPILANHFLQQSLREHRGVARRFSQHALDLLMGYDWPGNVRELANTIERAVVVADTEAIQHYHLPPALQTARPAQQNQSGNLFASVEAFEKDLIFCALQETRGNRCQAARALGISERVLSYKIKKYSLDCAQFRASRQPYRAR
jgi:Nif-specific regulatory protein